MSFSKLSSLLLSSNFTLSMKSIAILLRSEMVKIFSKSVKIDMKFLRAIVWAPMNSRSGFCMSVLICASTFVMSFLKFAWCLALSMGLVFK